VLIYDGCEQPVGAETKPGGRSAADRIRELLSRAGIPPWPGPDVVPALDQFRREIDAVDVIEAVTQLRNRFTHPRRRAGRYTADTVVLADCWRLVMWWLQLVLLHEFGYAGGHIPHLVPGSWRRRAPVPWAAPDDAP